MNKKRKLIDLLTLRILEYTNQTMKVGELDMPNLQCGIITDVDYIALYSQPATYHATSNTCIGFFDYDIKFNGINGLWNAIYHSDKKLQEYYIKRFKGVRYFISPDISQCGDALQIERLYRYFKSRVISIWLTMNLDAVVIPLVTCANEYDMKFCLSGLEDCETVAFNTKGQLRNLDQK